MPLDPFFSERLRVHRRYLFDQALGTVRSRVRSLLDPLRLPWSAASAPSGQGSASRQPHAAPAGTAADAAPAGTAAGARAAGPGPHARARAKHRRAALAWDRTELRTVGTPGPGIRTTEHEVDVPGYPAVRVRIYHPDADGPVPGVLAFFGGAFRIGGIDYPTTDAAFRRRAADAGVAMVAVDYALAPEHRYPTQVEQAHAALEWLFDNADALGVDAGRIAVAGCSTAIAGVVR
jgi:acetyl esterase